MMKPAQKGKIVQAVIEQSETLVKKHFNKILEIKGDDNQINFGLSVQIEGDGPKSNVAVKLSFSEKHTFTLETEIDDPDQMPLPGTERKAGEPTKLREKSKKT
jgi:hypothetical protein